MIFYLNPLLVLGTAASADCAVGRVFVFHAISENADSQCSCTVVVKRRWKGADEAKRAYYENFLVALANISYDSIGLLEPYFDDPDLPQTDLRKIVYEVSRQILLHF